MLYKGVKLANLVYFFTSFYKKNAVFVKYGNR